MVSTQSEESTAPFLPELEIDGPAAQRRWTVLLRGILLIPHFVVLYFVGIAAAVVSVIGWVATLIQGWLPEWIADFLTVYIGYRVRVGASLLLLVDRYPPFVTAEPSYPVRIDVRLRPQNRLTVLFRLILAIPAAALSGILGYGWAALSFFLWLAVLIAGRTPRAVFEASAAYLRFLYRYEAYVYLLTSSYPKRLFGDTTEAFPHAPELTGTRPLVLSRGGRMLLIAFLVLGVLLIVIPLLMALFAGPSGSHHGYDTAMWRLR
jgi:hypothetical protein